MRDHFLKLGLDLTATSAEILEAIEAKPEQSAAADILLNELRRAPYQRTVSTLRSIGILRHRLGLDNDNTWFVESCADFAPRLHSRKYTAQPPLAADANVAAADTGGDGQSTAADVLPAKSTTPETVPPTRPWLKPAIIVLAIAAVLILLIVVL